MDTNTVLQNISLLQRINAFCDAKRLIPNSYVCKSWKECFDEYCDHLKKRKAVFWEKTFEDITHDMLLNAVLSLSVSKVELVLRHNKNVNELVYKIYEYKDRYSCYYEDIHRHTTLLYKCLCAVENKTDQQNAKKICELLCKHGADPTIKGEEQVSEYDEPTTTYSLPNAIEFSKYKEFHDITSFFESLDQPKKKQNKKTKKKQNKKKIKLGTRFDIFLK